MASLVQKELRRLAPLLLGCLICLLIASMLIGMEQYIRARGKIGQLQALTDETREQNLAAVEEKLRNLQAVAGEYGYDNDNYGRTMQVYRYLLQRGIPEEHWGTMNTGSLLLNISSSLPFLLAVPAALIGGLLATRRSQPEPRWQTVGLSKLLALLCSLVLLSAALLTLVALLGGLVFGTAAQPFSATGLSYPHAVSSFGDVGFDAFVILARWQAILILLGYGTACGLVLGVASAAISLLSGHWLVGSLLAGGASLASLQLPWLTGLFTFLNANYVWLQAGSRGQLAGKLAVPIVLGAAGISVSALAFPRSAPAAVARRRLHSRRLAQRIFRSVRWRFILLFILSGLLAVIGVFIALGLAFTLYRLGILRRYFEDAYRAAGLPLIISFGISLFVVFFFLLTSRITLYLEEISQAVSQISRGDWSVQIPRRYNDELGELAENINSMSRQLAESREEERRAEQAKTELITSVSHDLRTPLTSILGYLDLIAESDPTDSGEWQRYAGVARGKAERLQRLIDGLFEYTRLAYGDLEINCRPISLDSLLRQLAEEFVPILQQAGMEQVLHLPAGKVTVLADGDLLVRVFDNLYSNAIRYGHDARKLNVSLQEEDGRAIVQVENFGSPIPEQDLPHIFERLYRADKARSARVGGAGLGLAIAKQIVELHQGSISVKSDADSTVFTVCVPLAQPAFEASDGESEPQ